MTVIHRRAAKRRCAGKGPQWEREVCRALSLWVTNGERVDVFWRSAMSGGRATVHNRSVIPCHKGDKCSWQALRYSPECCTTDGSRGWLDGRRMSSEGRVCRVGPGNFTPSPSQNRT